MPSFNMDAIRRLIMSGGRIDDALGGAPAPVPVSATPPVLPNIPDTGAPPEAPPATPAMATPVAESYKSPPDLVAMYAKLMEKQQMAEAIRRGGTMIAAGLTPYQSNREALLRLVGSGGGSSGDGGLSAASILAMQKEAAAQQERDLQRAQLPALMEKWGIDPATAAYLDSTGQLDEVIAEMQKPHTQVVDTARSGKILVDTRTGETIKTLSPSEPRETEYVDVGGGNHLLVYKDDKTSVADGKQVVFTGPTAAEAETLAKTAALPAQEKREEKKLALDEATEKRLSEAVTVEKLANGQLQPMHNGKPVGDPIGPETPMTTDDIKEYTQLNIDREKAGLPKLRLDEWILQKTRAGTEAGNLDDAGVDYGKPSPGQAWKRDPKTHRIIIGEDGAPIPVWIKGSPEYEEYLQKKRAAADQAAKDEAALKKGEGEAAEKADADIEERARKYVKQTIHGINIDESINILRKHGSWAGGWGTLLKVMPESQAGLLASKLGTITTGIALDELRSMRKSSPTGAALGNVTEKEDAMLKSILGSFAQNIPPAEIIKNLQRYQAGLDIIVNGKYDPSVTNKDGRHYREPTIEEVQAAIAEAGTPPEEGETSVFHNYKMTKTPIKK